MLRCLLIVNISQNLSACLAEFVYYLKYAILLAQLQRYIVLSLFLQTDLNCSQARFENHQLSFLTTSKPRDFTCHLCVHYFLPYYYHYSPQKHFFSANFNNLNIDFVMHLNRHCIALDTFVLHKTLVFLSYLLHPLLPTDKLLILLSQASFNPWLMQKKLFSAPNISLIVRCLTK